MIRRVLLRRHLQEIRARGERLAVCREISREHEKKSNRDIFHNIFHCVLHVKTDSLPIEYILLERLLCLFEIREKAQMLEAKIDGGAECVKCVFIGVYAGLCVFVCEAYV